MTKIRKYNITASFVYFITLISCSNYEKATEIYYFPKSTTGTYSYYFDGIIDSDLGNVVVGKRELIFYNTEDYERNKYFIKELTKSIHVEKPQIQITAKGYNNNIYKFQFKDFDLNRDQYNSLHLISIYDGVTYSEEIYKRSP